jgi:alkanesulfonate monooxygenase SsuD/methylene tetrahydromethanopterin reductase-like flavin-dependent oxidoreductase (luciferase family)
MVSSTKDYEAGSTGRWPKTRKATSLGLMVPVSDRATFVTTPRFNDIIEISSLAASVGFETLWYADHFSFPSDDGLRGSWDAWTLMAAVAARVPGVSIGPMVACTAYRNPGVIAKMSEMIDEITGGKFILGLGAGWQKDEYDQFGIQFEPRVSQFEEALKIIHGLVRTGEADLQGEFYQANEAKNLPRGPRPDGPPILIGSSSPRMLSLLMEYADAWNTSWYGSTEGIAGKLEALESAASRAGRDPNTITKTIGIAVAGEGYTGSRPNPCRGDAEAQLNFLYEVEDMGFSHICVGLDPCTPKAIEAYAPLVEKFLAGR